MDACKIEIEHPAQPNRLIVAGLLLLIVVPDSKIFSLLNSTIRITQNYDNASR